MVRRFGHFTIGDSTARTVVCCWNDDSIVKELERILVILPIIDVPAREYPNQVTI
jgi:hypothetical protein